MGISKKGNISIKELYEKCKIKWSNFYVVCEDAQGDPDINFELAPEDYLNFAKNNLKTNNKQNCVDGITNIKRAIDSQIDLLINSLGYDFKVFDNNQNIFVKNFINLNYKGETSIGINSKLKLLNILGLAPTFLISNIRNIRNQVEHEYTIPKYKDLKIAIEVAELFINSSIRKFNISPGSLCVGNKYNQQNFKWESPFLKIDLNTGSKNNSVEITYYLKSEDYYNCCSDNKICKNGKISLTIKDEFYIDIVNCFFSTNYNILAKFFRYDIDEKYIQYTNLWG